MSTGARIVAVAIAALAAVGAGTAGAELPDPALAADRGQVRTWFVPMASEGGELGNYAIAVDSRGRVITANGDLAIYDGATLERLPRPGGAFTSALAVDVADRIWTGNGAELGYYARTAVGAWEFHSVRAELPAEAAGYERIWSVHCVGESVVFVASQRVMRWRGQRFESWPLVAHRQPLARTEGGEVLIVPWGVPAGEPNRIWAIGATGPLHEKRFDFSHGPTRTTMIARADGDRWVLGGSGQDGSGYLFDDAGGFLGELAHPLWKLRPLDAVQTPAGWVFGAAGGCVSVRYDGRLRFALSARTSTVPSAITGVLAAGQDGRIWGVNAFGLLGVEPEARVTYFGAEQGIVEPIGTLTRVGEELWLTATRGLVILGPSANPPATGRMTPGEDLPGMLTHSIVGARAVEAGRRFALVAAENLAIMTMDDHQWTVALDGAPVRARSFVQPWPGSDDDVLLAATEKEVYLLGTDVGRWPVRWRRTFADIDRVEALPDRRALLVDQEGRVWLLGWQRHGTQWELAVERRLTPARGLGRILRLDRRGDATWLYTADAAWVWRAGTDACLPLATDLPPGAALVAVASLPDGPAWALARAAPGGGDVQRNPVYALWRVRPGDGRVEGFRSPPVEVIDRLGTVNSATFEAAAPGGQGAVWWFTGTYGVARVSLERANRPLRFLHAPEFEAIGGDRGALSLAGGGALPSGSSLAVRYGYPQTTHALPVAYQTKLDGLDADWAEPTEVRRRRWERVPHGSYTLRLRAVDAAGQVSAEVAWPLTVRPRFTETRAFWLLVLVAAAGGGGLGVWGWTRRLRRRALLLERTVGERTAALNAANRELREQNDLRKEMIGVLAHDLKTPLEAGDLLAARAIERLPAGPARRDVEQLRADLGHLREVLDGNVDLSRIELGLVPVVWRAWPWRRWVDEIAAAQAAAAGARGLEWSLEVAGGEDRLVLVDGANHRRVVENLVSNALKYTPAGAVRVTVRWVRTAGPLATATWEIADDGPGLPEGVRAALGGEFRRPELHEAAPGRSSGLGLAVTARLVRLAGGALTAEDRPPHGTLLRVELPVLDLGSAAATPDALEFDPPFALRALVVDDEPRQRDHVAEVLEPLGVRVDLAADCAEAEALAAATAYDVAFLDFSLPDGSGLELIRRMEATGRRPRVVAVVTAHVSATLEAAGRDAGCDAYLPKPLAVRSAVALLVRAR